MDRGIYGASKAGRRTEFDSKEILIVRTRSGMNMNAALPAQRMPIAQRRDVA
jgi:hypothetical protein